MEDPARPGTENPGSDAVTPNGTSDTNHPAAGRLRWSDWQPTLIGGALATVAVVALVEGFSSVSSSERQEVAAAMVGGVRSLASASIAAGGTIAALMLTTLGLLDRLETRRINPRFLVHLRLTAIGAFFTIGFAVAALVVSLLPAAIAGERAPQPWEINGVYWALLLLTALIVGGLAIVLSSLSATIADVLRTLPVAWVRDILSPDESDPATEDPEAGGGQPAGDGKADGQG